jgi:hypothetical protein
MDAEGGSRLYVFVKATMDTFFDQDSLETIKYFPTNNKGSFGLCLSSTLDVHQHVCLVVKGRLMSIVFYPKTGLVSYALEQAAPKAGMGVQVPHSNGTN